MSFLLTKDKAGQNRGSAYLILFLCLCLSLFLTTSCPEPTNNIPQDTTITLDLLSTWTTSVRLKVIVTETTDTWTFELTRDDSVVAGAEVSGSDTVVVDGGLNPGTEYSYRAFFIDEGERVNTSETITAVTMDTTSHSFIWEIDTLGEYGMLRDAFIIDENNVWVVGEIFSGEYDTTYNNSDTFYTPIYYGAGIWRGSEWSFKQLNGPGVNIQSITPHGIWAFSDDDIWFASGSIYHWDGSETTLEWLRDVDTDETVEAVWESFANNIYFVGNEGTVVHYDGSQFTRMESGTDVDLQDVWGLDDEHVWTIGRNWQDPGVAFLTLKNSQWESIDPKYQDEGLGQSSIWTDNLDTLYTAGSSGRWGYSVKDSTFFDMENVGEWVAYKIRGNNRNDMFTSGAGGEVLHYNGSTWKLYMELQEVAGTSTSWLGVDINEDFVVVCGYTYVFPQTIAIVARGYRYNR